MGRTRARDPGQVHRLRPEDHEDPDRRRHDSRGFYTSRCFAPSSRRTGDADRRHAPAIIDNVGRATGMPLRSVEMNDDVALDLAFKVREQTPRTWATSTSSAPSTELISRWGDDLARYGRRTARASTTIRGRAQAPVAGLADLAPVKTADADKALSRRSAPGCSTARRSRRRAASRRTWSPIRAMRTWAPSRLGFAPWTGGPISLIDSVGGSGVRQTLRPVKRKSRFALRFRPSFLGIWRQGRELLRRFGKAKRSIRPLYSYAFGEAPPAPAFFVNRPLNLSGSAVLSTES